ncbi:MAG TPA: carbohydrate kinase [Nocardioidaceae bacterium]|nr:carbohydrate kinase [Nocardioidaceae bacterium]
MPAAVLVVGEALVDITHAPGRAATELPGGSPMNVAVGLARLGVSTTLAAQVGDDPPGESIRRHLSDSGVRLEALGPAGPTATATARLDETGHATYEFDLHWHPAELPDPAAYALVHVGSIGSWMPPGAAAVADLVTAARAAGVPVSFDPNVRPALAPDLEAVRQRVSALATAATIVKLSDEDAGTLDGDAESVVDDLAGLGPSLVAMTRGSAGSHLHSGATRVDVAAGSVTVADTIGAGDAWMAGLLAGVVSEGWPMRAAYSADELDWLGRLAGTTAAITCSRPGADPPWRHELDISMRYTPAISD